MSTFFRDGRKFVDGRMFNPLVLKAHPSKSTAKVHRTVFWEDGFTSCNCTGWAIRKACTHTHELEADIETGACGKTYQDIRRLALMTIPIAARPATATTRKPNPHATYQIAPELATEHSEHAPVTIDGKPVVYRRIRLE
jgi:hypothetical protein